MTTIPTNIWMAPMVRGSELAFRMIGRKYGITTCFSPMMSAYSVLNSNGQQHRVTSCLEDRPLIVQLCGNQPKELAAAALKVVHELDGKLDGIDFNLGCPQVVADEGNFGAFLATRNPDLVIECIQAIRFAMNDVKINGGLNNGKRLSVSAKIRLQPTTQETISFAQRIEAAGCDLLSVHCRRPSDKHYGEPDYECGKLLVETLTIPVCINGGIYDLSKAKHVLKTTGAYSVMCAQGLLKNPRMLMDAKPCVAAVAAEYLASCALYPPPNALYIRKHLRWIFRDAIEPERTKNMEDYKAQFKEWRPRLWTFLVRPYLTSMIQFQQVVHLYCLLAEIELPKELVELNLPVPTFKSIKKAKNGEAIGSTRQRK